LSFRDRRHLKGNGRLCIDTAGQGGASDEDSVTLAQDNTLHMRTCANRDITGHLPEDVLRLDTA
jgi:hypothetical protein